MTEQAPQQSRWYLYLIETAQSTLYCGITLDVERRFREHASGGARAARSLRGRGPLTLRFYAVAGEQGDALRAERQVKQLTRAQKWRLVEGDVALMARLGLSWPSES